MTTLTRIAALVALAMVAVAGVYYYQSDYTPQNQCAPVRPGSMLKSQVTSDTFGGITEYRLPSQGRWPNAITTAPDGSVWFAEQEVPGVAHLFPSNGTLVEYAWPGYPTPKAPDCLYAASSSGIAIWNGRVWAADEFNNAVLGVNPWDGSTVRVNTTSNAQYPYWLAVGPDGDLWFTSDNTPASLGKISPDLTLTVIPLNGLGADEPIQITFVNSSLAFLATINEAENLTTKACVCTGHIYSFDPSVDAPSITPTVVGGNYTLQLPTSVAYADGRIWVAQHGPSSVLSYDFAAGQWTKYPTSTVPWSTTLPLVISANGSEAWFNEHYANKIAELNATSETLTEISESNPPAKSAAGIQNDESIALAPGGVWFTSESGNYVGFLNAAYRPSFRVTTVGSDRISVSPGGNATVALSITGSWSTPLGVNASDTEDYASLPVLLHFATSVSAVPAGGSPYTLMVTVTADQTIHPGSYLAAVTVTDGGDQQSAYIFIEVT
jgi:streptogramin lyase